jgi:ABC-type multidrug transport system ATPase subunit
MLILLDKPNVLILDEPDNDLDIDMLAVVESLLDTWPGTLLLITHDRYLMERVTDSQFALVDGKVRHVPGGVDEYLRLLDERGRGRAEAKLQKPRAKVSAADSSANRETVRSTLQSGDEPIGRHEPTLSRAEEYSLKKELASTERKLATLCKKADAVRADMKETDPSDYVGLLDDQARLREVEQQISDLEDKWMELSTRLPSPRS